MKKDRREGAVSVWEHGELYPTAKRGSLIWAGYSAAAGKAA
ncbi:hypothetical protein [Rhizohabitans arisaemae]|nr:hypothetical protein [Rhizohabitans arisaemae]